MKTLVGSMLALGLLTGAALSAATPAQAGCCDSWRADEDDARYGCYGRYYYSCGRRHHHHYDYGYGYGHGYGRGYGYGYDRWQGDRTTTRCNAFRCATYRCDWYGCERLSPWRWRR